jgi:arginine deiminase
MFHVDSEVGRLRQVILHRPGLELKRLTPDNVADLLFDDMLWVSRAQAEHDAFAAVLRARGVAVHYYGDLLAQTLDIPEARAYILDHLFDPRRHGPPTAPQAVEMLASGLAAVGTAPCLVAIHAEGTGLHAPGHRS